jgi:hypothetical protein
MLDGVPDDRLLAFFTRIVQDVAREQLHVPQLIAGAGGHVAYLAKVIMENLEDGDGDGDGGS